MYFFSKIGKLIVALFLLLPIMLVPGLPSEVVKAETVSVPKKRELRAAWISTVWNLDWPQNKNDVAAQKAEFITMLDKLKAMGMNAVVVQVRPMGDALYPTSYAPWSQFLTGTQGKNPGYDPLQFMIEEAHKRNLEFHAWFNPFRISTNSTDVTKLADPNPVKQHPDWKVDYNGGMYYNPGIPEVRKLIQDTILEVVRKYDIDAVHLDDYFYPDIKNETDFHDAATFAKYGSGFANIGDWRRNNINVFMKDLSSSIKSIKPYVKFGVSPNGIWKNIPYGNGQYTTGMESYNDVYADSLKWVKENTVDYITPQVYWKIGYKAAPYEVLMQWWKQQVQGTNVQLYMGHADENLGTNTGSEDWTTAYDEIPNQILLDRQNGISGDMHFRAKTLLNNVLGIQDRLKQDVYKYPALVPTMPSKEHTPPAKPSASLERRSQGTFIFWSQVSGASYYAIYRFKKGEAQNINDATKLLGTVSQIQGTSYLDATAVNTTQYVYAVTALDRLHNESQPDFVSTMEPIKMCVDQPAPNAELKGTSTIQGWSLAENGVSKVEVLVDGATVGTAKYGLARPDVYRVFPQYNNANGGFSYNLDTTKLSQGTHTLQIRTTANDGVQQTSNLQIDITRQLPIQTIIDEPAEQAQISGTQKLRGWALAEDGIKEIQVLVDGAFQGKAALGVSRPDVYRVYPQYHNQASGYEYSLNTKLLTQGAHTITLQVKTNSGDIQKVTRQLNVTRNLPLLFMLDTPVNGEQVAATYRVAGWALAEDGIKKAEVFVDGKKQGEASLGVSRSDVYRIYPKYNNHTSGYEYMLDTTAFTAGPHKLKVVVTSNGGDVQQTETQIQVLDLPARMSLDEPSPNQAVSQVQTVRGWALSEQGVSKVEVLVDGSVKGEAQYGLPRADVAKAFPLYNNGNSGFLYSLNTASLTNGRHTITVRVTGKDGKTVNTSSTILVSPLHGKTIVLDPGHGGMDSGATAGGYLEKDINLSVGLKLRDLLESYGAKVIMTRDTDTFIELSARAQVSNDAKADAFVSLHTNSADTFSLASGIETYYYEQPDPDHPPAVTLAQSSRLASEVENSLLAATGAVDRGAKGNNYAVLRENERPAILVELGFITNDLERARLVSSSYQQTEAQAVLDGLNQYFQ